MARILTVTFNPSVDRATATERLQHTIKMRCDAPTVYPGGGGLNVARVLTRLGADVLALHTAAGLTGSLLGELLTREGVAARAISVPGLTRDNLSVVERSSGEEYRFVMPGPQLADTDVQACMQAVFEAASRPLADWVVLSGSLPQGMPDDAYAMLARRLKAMGCRIALDAPGAALKAGLRAGGVDLIKPSLDELREVTGQPLAHIADQREAAQALVRGRLADTVVLSLGPAGAVLATRDGTWQVDGLPMTVHSTTGAGDSMLAAMVWSLLRGQHAREALRWGVAAGSAAVAQQASALGSRQDIEALQPRVSAPRPC